MTRSSLTLDALRSTIGDIIGGHFGAHHVDAQGDVHVDHESARVFVCARPWRERAALVSIFSVTNVAVPITEALTLFLASENLQTVFGHFALHADEGASHGDVWFGHTLLGDFLDADELVTALSAVARAANKYDDLIKARFGGRLYTEG